MDWPNVKMYEHSINGESYQIHRYLIPSSINTELQLIKKFFYVMDREPIPLKFKRRKQPTEYGDAATIILSRLDQFIRMESPIEIGSKYLSPTPWAIFGYGADIDSMAKIYFNSFSDIVNFYYNKVNRGATKPEFFHFRIAPNLPCMLADTYRKTPGLVMSVSICLLADIIVNCGPDCAELYDLYTNDLRDTPATTDINKWEANRCKVLGRYGRIKHTPYDCDIGQVYKPDVPMGTAVKFKLVGDHDDLASGERTFPTGSRVITVYDDYDTYGPEPDYQDNIEADYKYMARARIKYQHLGINLK